MPSQTQNSSTDRQSAAVASNSGSSTSLTAAAVAPNENSQAATRHNLPAPGPVQAPGDDGDARDICRTNRSANLSNADAWQLCKAQLHETVMPAFFAKFIEPLRVAYPTNDDALLTLAASNAKHRQHVEQRYLSLIRETLATIPGAPDQVLVRQNEADGTTPVRPSELALKPQPQARHRTSFAGPQTSASPAADASDSSAIQSQSVDSPAVSGFALAGHKAAAVNQRELDLLWRGGCPAGVLSLTGPSGSGKTAIARAYVRLQSGQGATTRYMSAEEFLTEFSLAVHKRENIAWRVALRAHRVLVIDDFQFIKPQALRSQEELQYLVDEFQENGHLLILCSDRDAADQGLTAALLSRLQAGHRIQLAYPAHAERETILAEAGRELDLAREHISYLAGRISRDMRQLKSAIRRLIHARELQGADRSAWTSTELDQVCADLYTRRPTVSPDQVRAAVAEYFRLTPEAIRGPIRDKQHSMARHLTAYLCTEHLQLNLKETAGVIGRREHGSVIHARKKIEETLERDLFLRKQVQELTEKIFSG